MSSSEAFIVKAEDEPVQKRQRVDDSSSSSASVSSSSSSAASSSSSSSSSPTSSSSSFSASQLPAASTTSSSVQLDSYSPPPTATRPTTTAPKWVSDIPTFLQSMHQYEPTIPDEVVQYLLERSGCIVKDAKLLRAVSFAAQHFLFELLYDCAQLRNVRLSHARYLAQSGMTVASRMKTEYERENELNMSDLSAALKLHGINIFKPDYYADNLWAGGVTSFVPTTTTTNTTSATPNATSSSSSSHESSRTSSKSSSSSSSSKSKDKRK